MNVNHYDPMVLYSLMSTPTPSSNTGSKRQIARAEGFGYTADRYRESKCSKITGHPDYLVICGSMTQLSSLEAAVWAAFGTRFDWSAARPGVRGKFYELNVSSPVGLTLSLNDITRQQKIEFRLSIPGKPLGSINPVRLHEFGKFLLSLDCKCTRFDWAIDDFTRTLDIDVIYSECLADNRHGFDSYTYYQTGKRGQKNLGKTIYLGSFGSDYFARIYDKNVESNGAINSIRFEIQTADEIANSFFNYYFGCNDIPTAIVQTSKRAIGKYRFVVNCSDVLSRCPDSPWWGNFVKLVGGQIKVSVPRLQTMISDKKRWIESQVTGTLSLIFKCMGVRKGVEWLMEEIRKKSIKNEVRNHNYYETWTERRQVATEDYDFSVSRFIEEREFLDLDRLSYEQGVRRDVANNLLLFFVRTAVILGSIQPLGDARQLSLFP